MSIQLKSLAALVACALLAPGRAPAALGGANVIRSIDVGEAAGAVEVAITGTHAPSYTVFKLQDPPRLVVDLAGVDEAAVEHPATAVRAARARRDGVALALDGEVARFEVIELANPPRLAIDLFGVASAPRAPVALAGAFKQARFGRDAGKVRVVLDAAGDLPRSEVRRVKGGLA